MKNLVVIDERHNYIDHTLDGPDALSRVSSELFQIPYDGDLSVVQYNLILNSLGSKFRLMRLDANYSLEKEDYPRVILDNGRNVLSLNCNKVEKDDWKLLSEMISCPVGLLMFLHSKRSVMKLIPVICETYKLNYLFI